MMRAALLLFMMAAQGGAAEPTKRKLAGLVVRSKDWTVHRDPKAGAAGTVEEWTGDVSYRHQGREIFADWAERRHADDRWHARGRVRVVWKLPDATALEARGEEARHDGEKDAGSLLPKRGGRLEFTRTLAEFTEPDRGEAGSMEWDIRENRITLEGSVRTWGPSGRSWADRADYDTRRHQLELTGRRPVLLSGAKDWDGAVQADRIIASDEPRRVLADGEVRGWAVFRDRPALLGGR